MALTGVQSEEMKTIPQYIIKFISEKYTDEGALMAVAAIASIPILILFLRLSKILLAVPLCFHLEKNREERLFE